ncbi:MAG: hypothetical protein AB7V39_24440 [Nitrospiraceae bacterium]
MMADIELVYKKPLEEWDWEELSKGYPRDVDGAFPRRKPDWITPAIRAEAQRRMRNMSEHELMTYAQAAIATLAELMTEQGVDDFGKPLVPATVRADAAKYILNHVIGTPKARVEVSEHNPLIDLMAGVLVNPDGLPSHTIVEGEVVEDSDDNGVSDGTRQA